MAAGVRARDICELIALTEKDHKPWVRAVARWSVELLVVFVGVWLSLLAEDWRQARLDAETESESLARIAEDLDSDLADLRFNLARAQVGIDAGRQIARWAAARDSDDDDMSRALSALQFCSMLVDNAAEYVALRNSGNLGVLSDAELRGRIVAGYESRVFLRGQHADDCQRTETIHALMMPHVVLGEPPEASLMLEMSSDGFPDTSRPRVVRIDRPEELLSSQEFLNAVTSLVARRQFLARQLEATIESVTTLRDDLLARR